MNRILTIVTVCAIAASVLALTGCEDDNNPMVAASNPTGSLTFNFDHGVGASALTIESSTTNFRYTNAAGNAYNVSDLRYYVSNFKVHKADGTVYGTTDAHYRDADPAAVINTGTDATRSYRLSKIPAGAYTAISFTFGLDEATNATNGLPPANSFLPWPTNWGGGYHYMEMNGQYDSGGGAAIAHKTHAGRRFVSTGEGMPPGPDNVAFHHFFEVRRDVTFEITEGDAWETTVLMDVNGWYANPVFDLSVFFPMQTSGIMIHLNAQQLLMQNGRDNVFAIGNPVQP